MWDPLQPDKTLRQIERYCAYQDRCVREVETKLKSLKVPPGVIREWIGKLENDKFLDDRRFVRSFAVGKFRHNQWGKIKIGYALKGKGIPEALIREGLEQIDPEEYRALLLKLLTRKAHETGAGKNLNSRQKMINFAVGKGFEMNLILDCIHELKLFP